MSDSLEERRRWFHEYITRCEGGVNWPTRPGVLCSCPCCGYPTLGTRGSYEICYLCNWEDDGQDDATADDVWGGPNGAYSLTEARRNFADHLVMYGDTDPRIGGRDSPREIEAKRSIIAAFDQIRNGADAAAEATLREQVASGRAILDDETKRKIRE